MKMQEIKDDLLNSIVKETSFNEGFTYKREQRYEKLMNQYKKYGDLYDLTLEEVLDMFELSENQVYENSYDFEGSWEVAQYIIEKEKLQLSKNEMKKAQEEYAQENGYEKVKDLLNDCGIQYVTEEIYEKGL